ncbi:MAG: RagB/SusD family nutrient uptake outer membrane protein [Chryseolinea sp.]
MKRCWQGVAQAYVQLRNYAPTYFDIPNVYNLHELSTDEIILPVRSGNWTDGGRWEELWKHTWTANSGPVVDGWAYVFSGISTVNRILESLEQMKARSKSHDVFVAEMRTLRAFFYYQAIDLFGNVPIIEHPGVQASEVATRTRGEVFTYVEKEITESIPDLSGDVNQATYGRITQWMAYTLLAKLYLNAEVFTGTARWADCLNACEAIITSGKYVLEEDFFSNFAIDNEGSRENIFSLPFDQRGKLGSFVLQGFTLHYKSIETFGLDDSGVNGYCSTAEYVNLFDDADKRKQMFLIGQQYAGQIKDEAHRQFDSSNPPVPLSFNPVITSFHLSAPEAEIAGARCVKWEINKTCWFMSNDFAVYRLADVILMKAEAQLRQGNAALALATINQRYGNTSIRSRAGMPDFAESEMTLDGLLAERARELSWEGHRRNDLIRFGHFTDARVPEKNVSEDFRLLFPIPKTEMDKNSYLKQNPGY